MQGFNGQKRVPDMSFDVNDAKLWEPLFPSTTAKAKETDRSGEETTGEEIQGLLDVARTFDCPLTWCLPLKMDRQKYLVRFPPTGKRTVQYSKSKASFFARGVNAQAMTTRVVEYLDTECTLVKAIHELFEHRQVSFHVDLRCAPPSIFLPPSPSLFIYNNSSLYLQQTLS